MRKARTVVLLLLMIAACDLLDYHYRGIENVDPEFPMPNQRKALFLYEQQVNDWLGVEDRELYKRAQVYYVVDTCPDTDQPSFLHPSAYPPLCVAGTMWRCEEMFVAAHESVICGSALMHEFTHCLAQHIPELQEHGYGDPQHKGPIWDFMSEFNKAEVCARGW